MKCLQLNPLHAGVKDDKETGTTGMVYRSANFSVHKKLKWNKNK